MMINCKVKKTLSSPSCFWSLCFITTIESKLSKTPVEPLPCLTAYWWLSFENNAHPSLCFKGSAVAVPPAREASSFYSFLHFPSPHICHAGHASVPALSSPWDAHCLAHLASSFLFILRWRVISGIDASALTTSAPTLAVTLLVHTFTASLPLFPHCCSEMWTPGELQSTLLFCAWNALKVFTHYLILSVQYSYGGKTVKTTIFKLRK